MTGDLALGEVEALARQAARGAGRSVGVAEDAGRAVRWLARFDRQASGFRGHDMVWDAGRDRGRSAGRGGRQQNGADGGGPEGGRDGEEDRNANAAGEGGEPRGETGAAALVRLLRATDGMAQAALAPGLPDLRPPDPRKGHDAICPLVLGGYLSDAQILPDMPLGPVREPLLLVPFLADIVPASAGGKVRVTSGSLHVVVGPRGWAGALPEGPSMVHLSRVEPSPDREARSSAPRDRPPRVTLRADTAAILAAFAARTHAPATEASRRRGAGETDEPYTGP